MATEKNFKIKNGLSIGDDEVISTVRRFYASDGTSAKAAYSFDGESSTGMYKYGSNQIGFTAGGSLKAYIQDGATAALVVSGQINATGGNSSNWNDAYGWGDHSIQGYLTSSDLSGYITSESDTLDSVTGRGNTTTNAISTGTITTSGNVVLDDGQITSDGTALIIDGANAKEVEIKSARDIRLVIDDNNDDTDTQFELYKHSVTSGNELLIIDQSGNMTASNNITADGSFITNTVSTAVGIYAGTTQIFEGSTRNLKNLGTISSGAVTSSTGTSSFYELTLTGDTDNLTFTEASGDWSILNAQQSNGLVIYDGTSGVTVLYNNAMVGQFNNSGFDVASGQFKVGGTTRISSTGAGTFTDITLSDVSPQIILSDNNSGGGGGAFGRILFQNTAGNAIGIGYTDDSVGDSDLIISTNAAGTYGGYMSLDAAAIADTQADIILEPKTNVRIATGGLKIGTTTFVDSSRNITAGTVSSGSITSSGNITAGSVSGFITAGTTTGYVYAKSLRLNNAEITDTDFQFAYQMIVDANDSLGIMSNKGDFTGGNPFGIFFLGDDGGTTKTLGSGLVGVWNTTNFKKAHVDHMVGLYDGTQNLTAPDISVTGNLDIAQSIRHTGDEHTGIDLFSDQVVIKTNNTERLNITNSDINIKNTQVFFNSTMGIGASTYAPIEGGTDSERNWLNFHRSNDASYIEFTNRTPAGKIVLSGGLDGGGGEVQRLEIEGGSATKSVKVLASTDLNLSSTSKLTHGTNTVLDANRNLSNIGTISAGNTTITNSGSAASVTLTRSDTSTSGVFLVGSAFSYIGTTDNKPFHIYQNGASALEFNTSKDAAFAGDISCAAITASGAHTFTANDVDFVVQDTTDSITNYIWRQHSTDKLYLGTANAVVDLRSVLKINNTERIDMSGNATLGDITAQDLTLLSSSGHTTFTLGSRSGDPTPSSDGSYDFRPGMRVAAFEPSDGSVDGDADLPLAWTGSLYLDASQTYATASAGQVFTFSVNFSGGTRWFAKVKTNDAESGNSPYLAVNAGTEYALDYLDATPSNGENDTDAWHVIDITDDVVTGSNTLKVWLGGGQKTYVLAIYVYPSTGIMLPNEPYESVGYFHKGIGVGDSRILDEDANLSNVGTISSGNITSSGTVTANSVVVNGIERIESDGDVIANNLTVAGNFTMTTGSIGVNGSITSNNSFVKAGTSNADGFWVGSNQIVEGDTRNLKNIGTISSGVITATELTITGGADEADLYINNTSPTLAFTDSNSFSDTNDKYIVRGGGSGNLQFQWYDDSENTTTQTFSIDPSGNADFEGTITSGAITSTDSSSFGDVAIGGAADSNYDLKVYGLARFEGAANFVDATNPIQVGGQTIIDGSRNLTNIGGISASGAHTLTANDVDFIIKDATDGTSNFIWRDHSASKLYLGTSDAVVDLRSNLKISNTTRIDTSGNGTFANITSNGSTVLTTADYDTHVCHLKTNINAAVDQGSANEFTINFNLEEHNDTTTFSHSNGVVTVASAGWYRIYANMVYDNAESSQRNTIRAYVEKNGTEVLSTATYDYDRGSSYGRFSNNKIETMLYLSANDTISIGNYAQNEDGTITIESGECEFIVNSVSVETTSTNCDTVDGLHASSFIRSDADDTATGEVTFTSDIFMNAYLRHTSNPGTHLRFEVDRVLIKAGNIEMIDCVEGTSDYVDIVDRVRVTAGGDLECEGNITAYTTTSISDINQKENIDVIENPIEKIKAISGYTFDWKQSGESSGGVIAQEIEQVMPSIVKETKIRDGDMMKAVDYQAIIGLLVETAKEQQQTIESLTQRIKEIENGNN